MKRDLNLVKEILLWAIDHEESGIAKNPDIPEYTQDQVAHHIYLMERARLVEAENITTVHDVCKKSHLLGITWDGHKFLELTKEPTTWNLIKDAFIKESASISLSAIAGFVKSQL